MFAQPPFVPVRSGKRASDPVRRVVKLRHPTNHGPQSLPPDREYLRRRAEQERWMTFNAGCVEAEIAHNELTSRYLAGCFARSPLLTDECLDCPLRAICRKVFSGCC
jgi:hypothetical protein